MAKPIKKNKNIVQSPTNSPVTAKTSAKPNATSAIDSQQLLLWGSGTVLVITTFLAFWGGFDNEFIQWDDQIYVTENYLVTNPSLASVRQAFRTTVALNYHPLTIVSLIINAGLSGWEQARPFIVTNTLLHVINVLVVFYLAWSLSNKNLFVALLTALLFSVHPMRVESVTWTSERKDVLYGFFFLTGCITYLKYIDSTQRKWFIWSLVLFVMSCLSKAQAVVFPAVMLLLDYWKGRPLTIKLLTEKWLFWVLALVFGLIAVDIQAGGNFHGLTQTVGTSKKALDLGVFTIGERLLFALYGFMMYCYKLVYPLHLSGFYPYEKDGGDAIYYWYGIPFFIIVMGLTAWSVTRTKLVAFGVGFFLVTVALVLQFISVGAAIMADRYTYLPYFGLFFLLAMALGQLIAQRPSLKVPVWGLSMAFVGFCFYVTTQQVNVWQNSGTFFTRITEVYPNDNRAYSTLGRYLGVKGQFDEAIKALETAIRLGNTDVTTYENLGTAYGFKGQTQKAVETFTKAIEHGAGATAYVNRAVGYLTTEPAKAIADYEKAIALDPQQAPQIRMSLGTVYINTNQPQKAIELYNIIIDQDGNKAAANYYNRSIAKLQLNDQQGAIQDLKQALVVDPNFQAATQQLKALGVQ